MAGIPARNHEEMIIFFKNIMLFMVQIISRSLDVPWVS